MKPRETKLDKALLLEHAQDPGWYGNLDGYFDEYNNYVVSIGPLKEIIFPHEWTMIPEIVWFAQKNGIEVPKDPPADISRMF